MSKESHYKAKYGDWAGNTAGSKPNYNLCCEEILYYIGNWPKHKQCSKKCGHGPDGAYCKTHDPEAVKARQAKSDEAYRQKTNKLRYEWYGPKFYETLKKIADGHNDARGLAQEIIEEFKKGMR